MAPVRARRSDVASVRLDVDPRASKVVVRTRATGLLARFAHDLEIVADDVAGSADVEGDVWSAEVSVPVSSLRVAGALHGDRLDASVLSLADRSEIERRLHTELLGRGAVTARARGASRREGEVAVELGSASVRVPARFVARETPENIHATGSIALSLRALGVPEVKGPLGAFKVSDEVAVSWDILLRAPEAPEAPAG